MPIRKRRHSMVSRAHRGAALVEVMVATFIFVSGSAFLFSAFNKSSALLAIIQSQQQLNLSKKAQKEQTFITAPYEQHWNDITKLGQLTLVSSASYTSKTSSTR